MQLQLVDIVVDTNVFVHSHNSASKRYPEALQFLLDLRESVTVLCFDAEASPDESLNTSRILTEYRTRIPGHSTAAKIVSQILQSTERWRSVSDHVPVGPERSCITKEVRDGRDRLLARVALNTSERVLVTHDDRAFPARTCKLLSKTCGMAVLTAGEVPRETEDDSG